MVYTILKNCENLLNTIVRFPLTFRPIQFWGEEVAFSWVGDDLNYPAKEILKCYEV